jgi:hypothetical protein
MPRKKKSKTTVLNNENIEIINTEQNDSELNKELIIETKDSIESEQEESEQESEQEESEQEESEQEESEQEESEQEESEQEEI